MENKREMQSWPWCLAKGAQPLQQVRVPARACLLTRPCDGPALSFRTVKVCADLKRKEV